MRLLLDEMIGPRVASALREQGHDVESVVERVELRGLPDDAILEHAAESERILVTRNVADFARLHQHWLAEGRGHAGVLFVTEQAFPQNRSLVGALVTALLAADAGAAMPKDGEAVYLLPSS